ncbi:hypothetical protein OOZ15_15030 [Galbibacter sp. EGI 63066]|uniref:hypothetical protein n=1 Tax=Galbibacter sp. EGI 63066 TaxID=2993559 RepID=UPI002248C0FB|nr:hypothetical protein [Galbibacter sp. EGI 63066]MCX2681264.1 hypothetical protein [Galbibacter sp. EGI 63066]
MGRKDYFAANGKKSIMNSLPKNEMKMTVLEQKKLQVLERLALSNDESLFDEIKILMDDKSDEDVVPEEHYRILMEEHEAYLRGETKSFTWEEVKQNARKALEEIRNKKA